MVQSWLGVLVSFFTLLTYGVIILEGGASTVKDGLGVASGMVSTLAGLINPLKFVNADTLWIAPIIVAAVDVGTALASAMFYIIDAAFNSPTPPTPPALPRRFFLPFIGRAAT